MSRVLTVSTELSAFLNPVKRIRNSFAFLIASVIVITIGEMIVSPTTLSYASIIADPHHKGRYLGLFNLSHSLGWSFAPLVGGVLLDTFTGGSLFIWGSISGFCIIAALGFVLFKSSQQNIESFGH